MAEDSQTKIIIEQIMDEEIEVEIAVEEDLNRVLNLRCSAIIVINMVILATSVD